MTWRAIWQDGDEAIFPGGPVAERLFRGTIVAEVDLARLGSDGDPLLHHQSGQSALTIGLTAVGRVYGRMTAGGVTGQASCGAGSEAMRGTLRLSFQWDAFNRFTRMTAEHLDAAALRQAEGSGAPVPDRNLLGSLFQGRGGHRHPGLRWIALADTVVPVATPPGLSPDTRIETPQGPRRVGDLRAGDAVVTADAGIQRVMWSGGIDLPAYGADRPVRLLGPFYGRDGDLLVHPRHRVAVSGPEVEYLFGCEEVLIEARHLIDGLTAVIAESGPVMRYHGIAFLRHHLLIAEGARLESQFLGGLGSDPALARTTAYCSLADGRSVPLQRATRRQIDGTEAAMLVQARTRRLAPLAA